MQHILLLGAVLLISGCEALGGLVFVTAAVATKPIRDGNLAAPNHELRVTGVVVDEAGQPVPGVTLSVDHYRWTNGPCFSFDLRGTRREEQVDGRFKVRVQGTHLNLLFTRTGYEPVLLRVTRAQPGELDWHTPVQPSVEELCADQVWLVLDKRGRGEARVVMRRAPS